MLMVVTFRMVHDFFLYFVCDLKAVEIEIQKLYLEVLKIRREFFNITGTRIHI